MELYRSKVQLAPSYRNLIDGAARPEIVYGFQGKVKKAGKQPHCILILETETRFKIVR